MLSHVLRLVRRVFSFVWHTGMWQRRNYASHQKALIPPHVCALRALTLVGLLVFTLKSLSGQQWLLVQEDSPPEQCRAAVAIAACDATLAWLERDFECRTHDIYVFARCDPNKSKLTVPDSLLKCTSFVDLTNVTTTRYGKAHHAYLHFILNNWYNLPETLLFLKDTDIHSSDKVKLLPCNVTYASLEPYEPPLGIRGPPSLGISAPQFEKTWDVMKNISSRFQTSPNLFYVAFRSNFATTSNQLKTLSRSYYANLLNLVLSDNQPHTTGCLNCEALERSWSTILGCTDSLHELHRRAQNNLWNPVQHKVCFENDIRPVLRLQGRISHETVATSLYFALIFRWDVLWSVKQPLHFKNRTVQNTRDYNGITLTQTLPPKHRFCSLKNIIRRCAKNNRPCTLDQLTALYMISGTCVIDSRQLLDINVIMVQDVETFARQATSYFV